MNCRKCKKDIPDASMFCNHCGAKQIVERSRRARANGMGTAYKRGKTWTASVTVGWKDIDGHPAPIKRTKGGFATKKEALTHTVTLLTTKSQQARKLTFEQVYEAWEAAYEKNIGKSTLNCYRAAKKYFADISYMRFENIGLDDLQDCIDSCPRGKRTKENMKALGTLLYKYALPRHIADMDYAHFIDCGDGKKTPRVAFSFEQIESIRDGIGTVPFADYIYCLIYTGFRPNEMLSLTREAYDPIGNLLTGGFKTEAGTNRVVTLSPKIAPLVREMVMRANPYIFPKEDGTLMRDDYFRENYFYPALEALGIQKVPEKGTKPTYTPYSCRHAFANLMKNAPGSDTDKAALMGHTSPEMTKYYQSADIDSLKRITDNI